ncbi:MAG: hypothetical protein CL943_00180 [Candidatus Diapherotrites archaeon]|uniref:Uncharacterized protein n=1 Tax=Candidatus Iainarchaeum sp. TaxID=3101447 RepID=A0A2D6LZV3_9ARCH|nr:hypothetical protein [Candidatus Diapherotrites archaeon]
MKGRKRRLENFDKRAEAAFRARKKGKYRISTRDGRRIMFAVDGHKRLVLKFNPRDVQDALKIQNELTARIKRRNIVPKKYVFVPIKAVVETRSKEWAVQEYLNKPSLNALRKYFEAEKDFKRNGRHKV